MQPAEWRPAERPRAERPAPATHVFTPQHPATPTALPKAESTAPGRDRDSAFAVSRVVGTAETDADAGVGGFDALFADLTVVDDEAETGRGRGTRSARAERAPKKDKKARKTKPAKASPTSLMRGAKAAVGAASAAIGATAVDATASAATASAATAAATAAAASAATASGVASASGVMPAAPGVKRIALSATPVASETPAVPTAATSEPSVPSAPASAAADDFAAAIAAAAMGSTTSSHTEVVDDLDLFATALRSDAAAPTSRAATSGPSRSSRRLQSPAPGIARRAAESMPGGRGATSARLSTVRPSSTRPPQGRRRRGARSLASVIAMSFAALLAVATSVPSLSLLTPADVQAMALEHADVYGEDGQRVVISGGVLAQSVQSEGYESQTVQEYAEAAGIRADSDFINNPAGTIQWPFAVGVHIGDRFGYRDCYGCSSDHGGQDFNPGLGAEIQAIADGTVVTSTDEGGSLGVVVMIDHIIDGELITSVYAHMEYGSRRFEVGDTVEVADVLGTTGSTGMSTGPHLHFEIRIGGVDGTKVDPLEWLYANTN